MPGWRRAAMGRARPHTPTRKRCSRCAGRSRACARRWATCRAPTPRTWTGSAYPRPATHVCPCCPDVTTPRTWTGSAYPWPASHVCPYLNACSAASPARFWHGACRALATFEAGNDDRCKVPVLASWGLASVLVLAVQVRHAAEDQVGAARQEAQRAIRDLQTAASRLQVPLTPHIQPQECSHLAWDYSTHRGLSLGP